jgi:small subunit ribosomal protein S4
MIRKKNKFSWPRKLYDKTRIEDENKLVELYGLKNKREIWKAEAKTKYYRARAKLLITASKEAQHIFFDKLNQYGLPVKTIAEVLALTKEDILKRRLATIVWQKGLARTARAARQMIVHRKILVNDLIVDIPSYLVGIHEEKAIRVHTPIPKSSVPVEVVA